MRKKLWLFLDVDGVLNCAGNFHTGKGNDILDFDAVQCYKDFIKKLDDLGFDVTVVLASTWRTSTKHKKRLKGAGINWTKQTLVRLSFVERDHEILEFIQDNQIPFEDVIILDDSATEKFWRAYNKDILLAITDFNGDPLSSKYIDPIIEQLTKRL